MKDKVTEAYDERMERKNNFELTKIYLTIFFGVFITIFIFISTK